MPVRAHYKILAMQTLFIIYMNNITILSKNQILEIKELAFAASETLTDRQLFTHMGILNSLVWRAATDYQAIRREEGIDRVVPENWNNLLACSAQGNVQITVPLDFTEGYLQHCWAGAYHNTKTLLTYRKLQISWGLFWYDLENRPKGAAWGKRAGVPGHGVATPPVLERVDIAKMLIFYQVFDQVRRDRINESLKHSEDITAFNCMPEHGGMLMVELYNALFFALHDFRGTYYGIGDVVVEAPCIPAVKAVVFQWKRRKGLFRSLWERMVKKAGSVATQAKKIVTDIKVDSLGNMAEVPY
jgi:hypothetical protein